MKASVLPIDRVRCGPRPQGALRPSRRPLRQPVAALRLAVAVLLAVAWLVPAAHAQAPGEQQPAPAPAPGLDLGLGEVDVRVHLVLIDQLSYTVHPFFQITGDPGFRDGRATTGTFFSIGSRETDQESNVIAQALHALPPFGVEGVTAIDLPFPRGLGFGLDYSPLTQVASDAAEGVAVVTDIRMDAFYYSGVLRFYFFEPTEPGVNYFVGLGLGFIDGTVKRPKTDGTADFVSLSQYPVGSTRLGLEARGETVGFRYELMVLNAEDVGLESNPYNNSSQTQIDFSGALVRLTLFFQF